MEAKQSQRETTLKRTLFSHFRSAKIHHNNKSYSKSNLLSKATASIVRASGEEGIRNVISQSSQESNGVVRVKILVRKQDLDRVLEVMMRNNNNENCQNKAAECGEEKYEEASLWIEERMNQLRKKHKRHNSWSPRLQTIPEDILAY